jgi:hypothetical protein
MLVTGVTCECNLSIQGHIIHRAESAGMKFTKIREATIRRLRNNRRTIFGVLTFMSPANLCPIDEDRLITEEASMLLT